MRRGRRAVARAGLLALAAVSLQACDLFGPSGPGTVDAFVESGGAAVGAVIVEVQGPGVVGVEAGGDARVYQGTAAEGVALRAVVVSTGAGELRFRISVEDRGADLPVVTVVEAVDSANRPIAANGVRVRVER